MLRVQTKNLGAVAVLRLKGQIVTGETEILHQLLKSVSGVSTLVLDLAQVTTVDARGLGMMLELREQAEAKGIRLQLMNVSRLVNNVLRIARLDSVFEITARVESFHAVSRGRRVPVPALANCA